MAPLFGDFALAPPTTVALPVSRERRVWWFGFNFHHPRSISDDPCCVAVRSDDASLCSTSFCSTLLVLFHMFSRFVLTLFGEKLDLGTEWCKRHSTGRIPLCVSAMVVFANIAVFASMAVFGLDVET